MTLYFLTQPGGELFSGYGIPAQQSRKDHLYGLMMIDRPQPANRQWLADVEATFGDLRLYEMTRQGDRGLLAQLHIRDESLSYVQEKHGPITAELERVVCIHCHDPPKVSLNTWWDAERGLWRSEFHLEARPASRLVKPDLG